jgi:hypothetical protein
MAFLPFHEFEVTPRLVDGFSVVRASDDEMSVFTALSRRIFGGSY